MKNFSHKLFYDYTLKQIFFGSLLFGTTIFTLLSLLLSIGDNDPFYKSLILGLIIGLLLSGMITSMINLVRDADKFYRYADKVEEMIRDNEPQKEVIQELRKLGEMSFHRNTSDRVRELIKMTEVKYNINLMKK